MPTEFASIDLATLNTAQGVMVTALREKVCQWEQDSADAALDGNFNAAATIQQWAFAADLLSRTISIEFSSLFAQALTARFDEQRSTTQHLGAYGVLNAVDMAVAATQEEAQELEIQFAGISYTQSSHPKKK